MGDDVLDSGRCEPHRSRADDRAGPQRVLLKPGHVAGLHTAGATSDAPLWCIEPGVLTRQLARVLVEESAVSRWRRVEESGSGSGLQARGPQRLWFATPGPRLQTAHETGAFRDRVARFAGASIAPTRAAFLRYEPDDFMGPHMDLPVCQISMIIHLTGPPSEVVLHAPHDADAVTTVRLGEGDGLLFWGSKVLHERRNRRRDEECIVATLAYAKVV
jgi:hypothetical protein